MRPACSGTSPDRRRRRGGPVGRSAARRAVSTTSARRERGNEMPRSETCKPEFTGDGARFCSPCLPPRLRKGWPAPGQPAIPGAPGRPPAAAAALSDCNGPSPGRPSDAASRAARTGGGTWARSRLIGGHRGRRHRAPRRDSTRRHGVGAAGPRPARSGRSGGCARTVTPSSRRVTNARAEPERVVVRGRRRSAPLPWRRPFTLASPPPSRLPYDSSKRAGHHIPSIDRHGVERLIREERDPAEYMRRCTLE